MSSYDVIIVGAGPGGYVTAIRAAQLGFKTAIVEREHLGGICLNWGCIPTKALLRSAEIYHQASHAEQLRTETRRFTISTTSAVVKRSRGVSAQLNGGVGFLLKKNKVDVIWGEARIDKSGEVDGLRDEKGRRCSHRTRCPRASSAPALYKAEATSSSQPVPARASCPASNRTATGSGPISRRWCRKTMPKVTDRDGLRRHRHRVRIVLSHDGRRRNRRRTDAADPAGRRRRDRQPCRQGFQKQGMKMPDRRQG